MYFSQTNLEFSCILSSRTYCIQNLVHPSPFHNDTMTNKRKYFESHNGENALYSKRSRFNDRNGSDELPSSSQPRLDPTYGQRGAFPGLDDCNNDDGLFYGPASDGLEYLRMVR